MIPIPPQLIEFAFSKGGKLVGVLVLLLALAGAYFYWHHQVYKTGYDAAVEEYRSREVADTKKEAKLIADNAREIKNLKEQFRNSYIDMVTEYAKENKDLSANLADANQRLRVNVSADKICGKRMSTSSGVPEDNLRRPKDFQPIELEPEIEAAILGNAQEVERAAIGVREVLKFLDQHATIK